MPRVNVSPQTSAPTHDVSLSDNTQTWGLQLAGGPRGIQETPQTPSTLLLNNQGQKWGDFEPSSAHLEQRTYTGGRGEASFVNDNSKYFDSLAAWTMTPDKLHNGLQWSIATGHRVADQHLPGAMSWVKLIGANRYVSVAFEPTANYSADYAFLWLRRAGSPDALTVELCANNSGEPGTVLKSATITTSDVTDTLSEWVKIDWTTTQALTSGAMYWLKIYGAAGASATSHWQVGTLDGTSGTRISSDGTTWTVADHKLFYRVCDAGVAQRWKFFDYKGTTYAVTIPDSGNSRLFSASGTAWTEITGHGLTVISDVLVANGIVYFAQGEGTNIRRWNGTDWADDSTNKATYLEYNYDATSGQTIWRANTTADTANTVSAAPVVAWGNNLAFATAINLGAESNIINLANYNNNIWAFKKTNTWIISGSTVSMFTTGLDALPRDNTGAAAATLGSYLFYSYSHTLMRVLNATVDDVGPWKGAGLPSGRTGQITKLLPTLSWLYASIDAGASGYSSVLVYDGVGWNEVFRSPTSGTRIRDIHWQIGASFDRMFIDMKEDIYYVDFPKTTLHPLRDSTSKYQHESVLITSAYDFGLAGLPKVFKELNIIADNLGAGIGVDADYQADENIGSTRWISLGSATISPTSTIPINLGGVKAIRFRLRLQTNSVTTPPIINAVVLEGFARTPIKYQWTLRLKVSSILMTKSGTPDSDPDKFLNWLKAKSVEADSLTMRSTFEALNHKFVIAEPPTVFREFQNNILKMWGGTIVITLREV